MWRKKAILAYWGKIGEKCQKCVALSETPPNGRKMPGTPPKFFWQYNRSKRLPEKNWRVFSISDCYFGHFVKNFGYFGGPKKPKNPKFQPILAKKQHLLRNFFHQFFLCFLENIHRNFDDHTTNTGGAISVSGLRPTDRNCLVFSSPCFFASAAAVRSRHFKFTVSLSPI